MEKKRSIVSRTLYNIHKIKDSVNKDPKKGLSQTTFSYEVARALGEQKILINYGTSSQPVYSFSETVAVNEDLATEIAKKIVNYRKEHYPYLYSKKQEEDIKNSENKKEEQTMEADWKEITDGEISESGLRCYTDEQLWNELKNRGWEITKDSCLRKTTIIEMR